jgi:hypothetical protein
MIAALHPVHQRESVKDFNGTATITFAAVGNQQIEQAPTGITTRTWDYENQQTAVLLPSGVRQTMTYNADLRQHWKE